MTLDQLREKAENVIRASVTRDYALQTQTRREFRDEFTAEVALALVEYVQANEAYDQAAAEAMHQDSAIYERAKAAFDDARARLFGLLGEAK